MIPQTASYVPMVFDTRAHRRNRDRASANGHSARFLSDWCLDRLTERLEIVKRTFPSALQLGSFISPGNAGAFHNQAGVKACVALDVARGPLKIVSGNNIQAAPDMLPFASASFDLVYSPFFLHTVNDLPGALAQIRRVLKPDGLFVGAMAGGETLWQLRACLMDAELALKGGASPRVFPFADQPTMGALMQRTGYALPVIDSEKVTVTYENAFRLMQDIRLMGESNIVSNRDRHFSSRRVFTEAVRLYQQRHAQKDGRIEATFDIIFLLGWSPHSSQQQPLRPGQGVIRLADVLES